MLRFAGDAKAAAIKEENEALKKAEVAVATSNAILREVCVCVCLCLDGALIAS
jgi:ribonuclease I